MYRQFGNNKPVFFLDNPPCRPFPRHLTRESELISDLGKNDFPLPMIRVLLFAPTGILAGINPSNLHFEIRVHP
jgi:hypothetical protein